jgi:hypothetical protein
MDSQKIKVILIVIISAIAAVYLGIAAATAQTVAILWVVGVLGVVFVLALGKNIWLLIAAGASLGGGLNFIPGSPKVWWIGMATTAFIFTLRFAMRRTNEFTWRWNIMDLAILIHIAMLAQAFLRNPVGLSLFGGSGDGMIGGRPYVIHGFAIACYVMLSMVPGNMKMVKIAAIVMISCAFFDGAAGLIGTLVPAVAMIGLPVYSGFSFGVAQTGEAANASEGRVTEGKQIGESLGRAAFTLYRPLSTLNPANFLGFAMMSTAVLSVLISGFRSAMGYLVIYFVVGSLLRRKILDIFLAIAVGIIGLCALLFIGIDNLPHGAKRILTVLPIPGLVDQDIKESAGNSTDWRVEMWMLALTTDRYIHNKMLGDGFGMRKDEMEAAVDAAFGDRRAAAGMDMQENLMARGSYHGFHVQTIRMTGYVGLFMTLVIVGVFFRQAWNHIRYFRNRPEYGYILYICVPFLIYPFYAMLVFADYRFGFPDMILMAGFLKMLWNVRYAEAREFAYQRQLEANREFAQPTARRERPVRALPAPAMRAR